MGRYFDAMREVIERHGGTVEKFIGDAIMAVFGIPSLHEDDALRAVRAAAEMRRTLSALNEELESELGVEIASGRGSTPARWWPATRGRGQTLVTGDTVNTAARLEQAAGAGEILIGEPTYRLVRDAVVAEPVEPVDAKGKAEPVDALSARSRSSPARMPTPADSMRRWLAGTQSFRRSSMRSNDRSPSGAAGWSPSSARRESASHGSSLKLWTRSVNGSIVLRGRCLPYGEGITYWPVAEAVRRVAAISDEHPPEEARRRIAGLLEGVERPDRIADGVAELIGLGEGARTAEEGFWAVRRFFEGLARTQPLVLVFDDIHWGEETFLDLLGYVVGWTSGVPVLVICLARKELLDRRPGWAGADVVTLASLGEEECESLLRGLLGTEEVPRPVTEAIAGTAEGNPLFVEELLAMLIDDGLLVRDDGHWTPSPISPASRCRPRCTRSWPRDSSTST